MRTRSFRRTLLRALPLLLIACGGHGRVAPEPGGRLTLLQCPRGNPAAAQASVDGKGDRIRVRNHTFELQPGSVRGTVDFQVRDRADGFAGVEIGPPGTRFETPARLTLSYAHCAEQAARFRNLEIVQVRTVDGRTEIADSTLNSQWNRDEMTVTTEIRHLSGYLISGT